MNELSSSFPSEKDELSSSFPSEKDELSSSFPSEKDELSSSFSQGKRMSCLLPFVASVGLLGVNPEAYSRFVDYTTNALLPTDNTLARSVTDLFSGLTAATLHSVIALIVMCVVLIIILLVYLGVVHVGAAFYVLAFILACLAIYFAIGYTFARKATSEVAIPLQRDIRETTILTFNSVIRDVIYLGLCE